MTGMWKDKRKMLLLLGLLTLMILGVIFYMSSAYYRNGPKVKKNTILHPTFDTSVGEFSAGTFFLAKLDGSHQLLAITALHIFGPAGGLERQYDTFELKKLIQHISLVDAFDQSEVVLQMEPLNLKGATVVKNQAAGDVCAFMVDEKEGMPYFKLSTEKARTGDRVWLATSVAAGALPTQKTHSAVVLTANSNELRIKYDNLALKFHGTSGSPVLNEKGEVIGINVGAAVEGGELIGYANPVVSAGLLIHQALSESSRE